jgi:omega-amidase
LKIALISLQPEWENKEINLNRCSEHAATASEHGCDLIIFPEMTLTGFSMNAGALSEEAEKSYTISGFSKLATQFKLHVVFGVIMKTDNGAENTAVVISPSGKISASYSKIHLFSLIPEVHHYSAGTEMVTCEIGNRTIGLTICYDLRFPALYQALSETCDIIINIANWPKPRIEHWNILLCARAIENQVFMIGVNRKGTDDHGLEYPKSSMIIDPLGNYIVPLYSERELEIFKINTEDVEKVRSKLPFRKDKNVFLNKLISENQNRSQNK